MVAQGPFLCRVRFIEQIVLATFFPPLHYRKDRNLCAKNFVVILPTLPPGSIFRREAYK